jgi:hypothetical protein
MKDNASASSGGKVVFAADAQVEHRRKHRTAPYQRVMDERKRPIRGLWVRNGRYYAQLTINQWKTHLGHMRLDQIKRIHMDSFIAARQKSGKSARTVNLGSTAWYKIAGGGGRSSISAERRHFNPNPEVDQHWPM